MNEAFRTELFLTIRKIRATILRHTDQTCWFDAEGDLVQVERGLETVVYKNTVPLLRIEGGECWREDALMLYYLMKEEDRKHAS